MAESGDAPKASLPGPDAHFPPPPTLEEQNRDELLKLCKRQVLLLQKTKAKLDEHKTESAEKESRLLAQLDELSAQNGVLQSQITEEGQIRNDLSRKMEELEAQKAQLEETVRQVQANSANLNDFNETTNELNLLREEKRNLLEELESLGNIKENALDLEKQIAKLLDENEDLTSHLKEANEKSSNLETELKNHQDESERILSELREELMQSESRNTEMEEERQSLLKTQHRMLSRIETLESNERTLTANHDNDQAHIFQLSDSLERSSQEETIAKTELHKFKSQLMKTVALLVKGLKVIYESPVNQVERFLYLSCDMTEEILQLSPPQDPGEGLEKFRETIKPKLQGFIRGAECSRTLEQEKQKLLSSLSEATEHAETLKAALDVEKQKRSETEQKQLEIAEECQILKSTTTALTNQLEETQLKLEQLMSSPAEANSTDDDKNSCDEARTESQLLALRERVTSLESDLENERYLREEAQRTVNSHQASLESIEQSMSEKETENARLGAEATELRSQLEILKESLVQKTDLIESLHSTIDDMVEQTNRNVFSHPDDGCSVSCKLLRLFEQLAQDSEKLADVEQEMQRMRASEDPMETWLRKSLQQLITHIKAIGERNSTPATSPTPLAADTHANSDAVAMLKERDEKIVKLRNLLVKMKKELVEVKAKQPLMANNIQSLQNEYDKAVDKLEAEKNTGKELQKKIAQTMERVADMELQLSQVNDEKRQLLVEIERLQTGIHSADAVRAEAEAQVLVVQNELEKSRQEVDRLRDELSQHIQQTTTLQVEVSGLQQQLEKHRDAVDEGQELIARNKQLESEVKLAKESFEKLVIEKAQCEVRLNEISTRAADADDLARLRERLENELEDTHNKLAEALRQIELLEASLTTTEEQLQSKNEDLSELRLRESERCQRIHELQESLQTQKDSQSRMVRTLEGKANALKKDYDTAVLELQESKKQFEAYKLKVHSMMKTKKEAPEKKAELIDTTENQALKAAVSELTQKLETSKSDLEAALQEIVKLREACETSQKDLRARYEQDKIALSATIEEEKRALRLELESAHRAEIDAMMIRQKQEFERREMAHSNLVDILEEKLVEARSKLENLLEERKSRDASHSPVISSNSCNIVNNNDVFLDTPVRQPAEGSESTGNAPSFRSLPFDVIPSSGFQPLDKLLEHQDCPSFETFESITSRLEEAMKRIDHFTELLNESEVNNLRLSEQVRVLKEEVRRLERNKEREEQFGNLEYLKNVVLKYLTMKSERERLVPVLVTMLKLSPDERRVLQEGDQSWGLLPKFL
ncbi:GRIP and coiled-coil domain-containing protein 2 [Galendromus occidentalis]|uniref:GRIP and coiled-coil domain-containing protein 2 n=1 Tax=Galendromus occidentalis TaxID=34638 RepID=A0AAJ6QLW8_9ACAR|nr:GRIP and coiled-coil domain-containing protein 2 [Galendromus occidentalis]